MKRFKNPKDFVNTVISLRELGMSDVDVSRELGFRTVSSFKRYYKYCQTIADCIFIKEGDSK